MVGRKEELLALIDKLNADESVDGILVQLPLPEHLNSLEILTRISPDKDVDGFHIVNSGRLLAGLPGFVPCTPKGIIRLIEQSQIDIDGKNAVVIGRSLIVGKPVALLLSERNATVTICHSHTKNLAEITKNADILVAAVGKPKFVTADMVKEGAVVIDVGMDRDENGKLCGDVDFDSLSDLDLSITPVPGGVGAVTTSVLINNVCRAAEKI